MLKAEIDRSPRGRELKDRHWWLVAGAALAAAMLLAALVLGSTAVQAQVPGAVYTNAIEVVDGCAVLAGVVVSDDGMSVVHAGLDFSGRHFHSDFDPAVPIAEDGSFTASFEADLGPPNGMSPPNGIAGLVITISGTFTDNKLNGTVNVSPSTCGDVPFSAAAATFGEPEPAPPPPGALVFVGTFEPIFDFLPQPDGDGVDDCGGGGFITTLNADGTETISIETIGLTVGGIPVDGFSVFEPGEFPIDENGNFSNEIEAVPGVTARNEGSFDFDADPPSLSGTVAVFSTTDPSNLLCEFSYSGVLQAVSAPVTGSGPALGSDHGALLWMLLGAGLSALSLGATGLAFVRRRET
ncbi:MAG: hypothetical protein IIB21_03225 [Chloroflexi bacterium]|nr:hypothetical protein [Chloroflexota bacterium]